MSKTTDDVLRQANKKFAEGDYVGAADLYVAASETYGDRIPGVQFSLEHTRKRLRSTVEDSRIVVYTCNFGAYESVKQPKYVDPSVRYILFTDDAELESGLWEKCVLAGELEDPRRASRLAKILPHKYLPEHDISIYIDSSLELQAEDVRLMAAECLEGQQIALYRHYKRDCVYDEIEFVMHSSDRFVGDKGLCLRAIEKYEAVGYPRKNGLFENALIVRRNTTAIASLNDTWWNEYIAGTERDQFVFMYSLWVNNIEPNAIRVGKQFRNNPYVEFFKHKYKSSSRSGSSASSMASTSAPVQEPEGQTRDPYVFIAYAPSSYDMNLGRTYNDYMERLPAGSEALFIDHDAAFTHDGWRDLVRSVFKQHRNEVALFTSVTNRINNPYQRVSLLETNHSLSDHEAFGGAMAGRFGAQTLDVAQLPSTSGVVIGLSKETWQKHKFADGFLKVDNKMHLSHRAAGDPVYLIPGLYVYHFYRADNDLSHAVKPPPVDETVQLSSEDHKLRNFVYSDLSIEEVARYMNLLEDHEFGVFVPARGVFAHKDWYAKLCKYFDQDRNLGTALLNDNAVDERAPAGTNFLDHRAYAVGGLSDSWRDNELIKRGSGSENGIGAFVLSKRAWLERHVQEAVSAENLELWANRAGLSSRVLNDIYLLDPRPQRLAARATLFTDSRLRVGVLTQGFWPQQAGMEMMVHNLASQLTAAGDDVVLFAPKPKGEFAEIRAQYIVRRYKHFNHMKDMFRQHHTVLPFDVLYVQGAYLPASAAAELGEELGIPVVLRTHGEDIQIDRESGYGYRLDPVKAEIIERNIERVNYNVVIGPHIEDEVRSLTSGPVQLIHNGVDTDHFRPQVDSKLREHLGVPDGHRILLCVGRNVQKKTLHLAIDVLARVREVDPSVVLVHAGKAGNGLNLREYAVERNQSDWFYELGETSYFDMPSVYAGADLFVFPAKTETFGNVTVEALASGLPCVEFDYVVNRQKISDGVDGFIRPHGDIDGMAASVLRLLNDKDEYERFSTAARVAAEEHFSWRTKVGEYRDIFKRAMGM